MNLTKDQSHAATGRTRAASRSLTGLLVMGAVVVLAVVAAVVALVVTRSSDTGSGSNTSGDGAAKSDLRAAVSALQQCYADNGNQYPATVAQSGSAVTMKCGAGSEASSVSSGNTVTYALNGTAATLTVTTDSGRAFRYDSNTGQIAGP